MPKRRRTHLALISLLVALAAIAATASSGDAATQTHTKHSRGAAIVWQMQTLNAPQTATARAYRAWAAALLAKAGIQLNISYSLGLGLPLAGMVAATAQGSVDVGELIGIYTDGAWPGLALPDVPGLLPYSVKIHENVEKALLPFYQQQADQHGQVYLGFCLADPRTLISTKPIHSLADLKGLKLRTAGGYESQLMQELGATPVTNVTAPEIYSALQTGVIDGAWAVDSYFVSQKFYEVAKYVLNADYGATSEHVTINKSDWDELSTAQQNTVQQTFNQVFLPTCFQGVDSDFRAATDQLKADGATVTPLSTADQKTLAKLTAPFPGNYAATHGSQVVAMLNAVRAVLGSRDVTANLSAKLQTPAPKGGKHASGKLTGTLLPNDEGASFTWRLSFSGLTGAARSVQLRIAAAGKTGPLAVTLCAKNCHSGMTGTVQLLRHPYRSLVEGAVYAVIATNQNPNGETRGQLSSSLQK